MRSVFIAVSKVFGLILVYKGLLYLAGILPMLQMFFNSPFPGRFPFEMPFMLVLSTVWALAVSFGFAWLLVFKAEWLADKLKIPEQAEIDIPPNDQLLFIGIILVGLYISVEGISQFGAVLPNGIAKSIGTFSSYVVAPPRGLLNWFFTNFLTAVFGPGLKLALGLLLVFKTRKVISWITKSEPAQESPQTEAKA